MPGKIRTNEPTVSKRGLSGNEIFTQYLAVVSNLFPYIVVKLSFPEPLTV